MAWIFGRGPDYYTDKLLRTHDEWVGLEEGDAEGKARVQALLRKYSSRLRDTMFGDGSKDPQPQQCEKLAHAWIDKGIPDRLPLIIRDLDFESRKNISMVYCALMRGDYCGFGSVEMASRPHMVRMFVNYYPDREVALAVGPMIRESTRVASIHAAMLTGVTGDRDVVALESSGHVAANVRAAGAKLLGGADEEAVTEKDVDAAAVRAQAAVKEAIEMGMSRQLVELMTRWVMLPNFEVSTDAFSTLVTILTEPAHKETTKFFLTEHADRFFPLYLSMLQPWIGNGNFTLQLQALKLLGEILLDPGNYEMMIGFIARTRHLRLVMNLLRSRQSSIQFEAFHVFKIFVANPHKPAPVVEVLMANREKLVAFLRAFQNDREDDVFHDEKALLIETLDHSLELPEGYTARLLAPRPVASAEVAASAASASASACASAAEAGDEPASPSSDE
jgi:hypothetical protein